MSGYLYLSIAIIFEVVATSALKTSENFTNLGPSLVVVVGYAVAFYCLSAVLKTIPVGIAYAIWSGMGIVLITVVGRVLFNQHIDSAALLGMVLIVTGVVIIYAFSGSFPQQG